METDSKYDYQFAKKLFTSVLEPLYHRWNIDLAFSIKFQVDIYWFHGELQND